MTQTDHHNHDWRLRSRAAAAVALVLFCLLAPPQFQGHHTSFCGLLERSQYGIPGIWC